MTWEADGNEAPNSTLEALESFIVSQRALLSRQRADIDRLQHLKSDLALRPGHLLDHLSEALADPAFRLSEQADLKLKLPPELDWKAFARSDPTALHALNFAIPTRTPLATQTAPLSELQSLVKHAARTLLEPRLRKYPRVPTPSPDSDCDNDAHDPIAARREREQAKIRELRAMVRRGSGGYGYGSGLRTLGLIRTDVGEEAMRAEVRIDDDDDQGPSIKSKWPGKRKMPGKHAGKRHGKAVPAAYIQADGGDNDEAAPLPAPSYATKNLGLVAQHARSAAASPELELDTDVIFDQGCDMAMDLDVDMGVGARAQDPPGAELPLLDSDQPPLPLPSPREVASPPKPKTKAKPRPKPKAKLKAKLKRAKASYEYTDDESDLGLDVDLLQDDEETYEAEYQDPRAFVPSVTIHQSSSSEAEDIEMLNMDGDLDMDLLDVALRKSSTKNSTGKAGAKAKSKSKSKSKPKAPPKKKNKSSADFTSSGDDSDAATGPTPTTSITKNTSRKPPKPKPETYKQAWSTEEQNHLEQLLEEIPDGERFRWQKISRAMGGRRTPRQVASRVQKYFEKLKKYDLM